MPIADPRYFTKGHVESHTFGTSHELAEQAIHCLELISSLSESGLSYQFKGGNSLLLILDTPRRFSIDIDIATDESRERIDECLDTIVAKFGVFTRWEKRQHKTKPWLPISSYYLHYKSHYAENDDASIMLDVQLRRSPYKTNLEPVVCGEIYKSSAKVELPIPASLMGDKLLTMGPYTLGIPLGKGKEAQRLKHVFDVSSLLKTEPALADIRYSFHACMEHENSLQKDEKTAEDVLADTIAFCGTVALHRVPPSNISDDSPVLRENVQGHEPFGAHIFAATYRWEELQRDMARVALAITAVCRESVTDANLRAAISGDLELTRTVEGLECAEDIQRLWHVVAGWLERDPLEAVRGGV